MTLQSDADMLLQAIVAAMNSPVATQAIVIRYAQLVELLNAHLSRHPDCEQDCACYERGFEWARETVSDWYQPEPIGRE